MKIIIKDIVIALLLVTLLIAFVVAMLYGFDKAEVVKCLKLQEQAREYPEYFYLTVFEQEMCNYHGIEVQK